MVAGPGGRYVRLRQPGRPGEYAYMDAPFVFAVVVCTDSQYHDLTLPERQGTALVQKVYRALLEKTQAIRKYPKQLKDITLMARIAIQRCCDPR
ncbi:hypothetical protein GCM10028792_37260 [Salinisphaera aquimarina]